MASLLCTLPCLSESRKFNNKYIHERLFDKKVDKRHLEGAIRRFIDLNRKMFDFLGIDYNLLGADNDLSLSFRSSNYIGAIPVRMPYDGIVHKDLQVTPRLYAGTDDVFSDLTQLLSQLDYSISPEFSDNDQLCNPMQLKPPMYYEAMKYVDLFDVACRYLWRKFDTRYCMHPYPKSSTDWHRYSVCSADPRKALVFSSHDSILTTDHLEWRELRYVFDIARKKLIDVGTPALIRYKYESKIDSLVRMVVDISPIPTELVHVRMHDPRCVTEVKEQANVLLRSRSTQCAAWRMDMAELFERYVQTIVSRAAHELSGTVYFNGKIRGKGRIPSWGLQYLEPDIMIRFGDRLYMADAKYKANYYARNEKSDILKETHRADLHQVLAYCSFEPQQSKRAGILFYPANETRYRVIDYSSECMGGTRNIVILCGLAFGFKMMESASALVRQLLQDRLIGVAL